MSFAIHTLLLSYIIYVLLLVTCILYRLDSTFSCYSECLFYLLCTVCKNSIQTTQVSMSLDILACLSPKVYFVAFIPLAEKKTKKKRTHFSPLSLFKKEMPQNLPVWGLSQFMFLELYINNTIIISLYSNIKAVFILICK